MAKSIYGTVNGVPVYSRNEYVFKSRGFGPITTDAELLAYAQKVTHGWLEAGWNRTFTTYYLGDYALDEPYASLTKKEYERLKELQKEAKAQKKREEAERKWHMVGTYGYADNSVEEVWEDKDGIRRTVMITAPNGDMC